MIMALQSEFEIAFSSAPFLLFQQQSSQFSVYIWLYWVTNYSLLHIFRYRFDKLCVIDVYNTSLTVNIANRRHKSLDIEVKYF